MRCRSPVSRARKKRPPVVLAMRLSWASSLTAPEALAWLGKQLELATHPMSPHLLVSSLILLVHFT